MKEELYEMINGVGKVKVINKPKGIVIKILKEEDKSYLDKLKKIRESLESHKKIEKDKRDREEMIQNKIREMAIRELESEGK